MQLDISASSEGLEDLGISKALFTRDQVKQIKERADTLLLRLQQLAERSVAESSSSIVSGSYYVSVTSCVLRIICTCRDWTTHMNH